MLIVLVVIISDFCSITVPLSNPGSKTTQEIVSGSQHSGHG
jgi:hypothetical protein